MTRSLAFICIHSCRHTDSGKLFFICGRLRGAGIAAVLFLICEDYEERGKTGFLLASVVIDIRIAVSCFLFVEDYEERGIAAVLFLFVGDYEERDSGGVVSYL